MELTCLPGIDIGGMSGRHSQLVTDYAAEGARAMETALSYAVLAAVSSLQAAESLSVLLPQKNNAKKRGG